MSFLKIHFGHGAVAVGGQLMGDGGASCIKIWPLKEPQDVGSPVQPESLEDVGVMMTFTSRESLQALSGAIESIEKALDKAAEKKDGADHD